VALWPSPERHDAQSGHQTASLCTPQLVALGRFAGIVSHHASYACHTSDTPSRNKACRSCGAPCVRTEDTRTILQGQPIWARPCGLDRPLDLHRILRQRQHPLLHLPWQRPSSYVYPACCANDVHRHVRHHRQTQRRYSTHPSGAPRHLAPAMRRSGSLQPVGCAAPP
jgi:hypothetical protein